MVIDRKGIMFFCMVFAFIMGFFILLGGVSFSRQQYSYIYSTAAAVQTTTATQDGLNLPLPKPSSITTEQGQIRLDLERVTVHQYYMVYSVIYGDQSHTAYHLFLTDLNRQPLDLAGVEEIWLVTATGERIDEVADPDVSDYPADQPLKWKIGIVAKFPHQATQDAHKLFLRYKGKTFALEGIRY